MAGVSEKKAFSGRADLVLPDGAVELHYFAYASDMNQEQISARCAAAKAIAVAKLADHRIAFFGHSVTWDGAEETVLPAPGHEVWGVVYELSPADRERLDNAQDARFDGTGSYFHTPAKVTGQDGTVYSVVLFKKDHRGSSQKPSQEYLDFIVKGAVAHSLPSAYVETLRGIESKKAEYAVPRPRQSSGDPASGSDCSSCEDESGSPDPVIQINLGSRSDS